MVDDVIDIDAYEVEPVTDLIPRGNYSTEPIELTRSDNSDLPKASLRYKLRQKPLEYILGLTRSPNQWLSTFMNWSEDHPQEVQYELYEGENEQFKVRYMFLPFAPTVNFEVSTDFRGFVCHRNSVLLSEVFVECKELFIPEDIHKSREYKRREAFDWDKHFGRESGEFEEDPRNLWVKIKEVSGDGILFPRDEEYRSFTATSNLCQYDYWNYKKLIKAVPSILGKYDLDQKKNMRAFNDELRSTMLSVTRLCVGDPIIMNLIAEFKRSYEEFGTDSRFHTELTSNMKEDDYWESLWWKAVEKKREEGFEKEMDEIVEKRFPWVNWE